MSCYRIMRELKDRYPITRIADVLGVSTSGFHEWRKRSPSARARRRIELTHAVCDAFDDSHGVYGSRKIAEELAARNVEACRNTVADVMRDSGLKSRAQRRRTFAVTTDSNHKDPIAPNRLGRDFTASKPNEKWAADITYVSTSKGWAYVAAVMDLHSRRIVGWSVSESIDTTLVLDALECAIETRRPGAGLMHHSDRGVQYASGRHRAELNKHGIACSMSRRGDCWDNAPMERFMNALKNEWTNHHDYADAEEVRRSVFAYIEIFYNRKRLHQALGYVSPADFEAKHRGSTAA